MIRSTPGGARNFLVPSRLNRAAFYALADRRSSSSRSSWCGMDRYIQKS